MRPQILEDGHRPFGGDERLVVARYDQPRTGPARGVDHLVRRQFNDRRAGLRITQRLAGHPVLAITAMEITTEHPERERVAAGINVEKRFFLDRIARQSAGHVTERHA